jgi:hypothetical protein
MRLVLKPLLHKSRKEAMSKFKLINIRGSREYIHIRLHQRQMGILLGIIAVCTVLLSLNNIFIEGLSCSRYVVYESHQRASNGVTFGLRKTEFGCQFGGLGTDVIIIKYENTKEVSQKLLFITRRGETVSNQPYPHRWVSGSELEIPINHTIYPNLENLEWHGLNIKYTNFK